MVICIDENIKNSISHNGCLFGAWYKAIDQILDSVKNGYHLFFTTRENIAYIRERMFNNFSSRQKLVFNYIEHHLNDINSIKNYSKCSLTICERCASKVDNKNTFLEMERIAPFCRSVLMTENNEDYEFYINFFRRKNKSALFDISFEQKSINGGNRAGEIRSIYSSKTPFLIITDSDKEYAEYYADTTSIKVQKELMKYNFSQPFFHYTLHVREKENLIPFACYKDCSFNISKNHKILIDMIEEENEFFQYFWDIKSGYKCFMLRNRDPIFSSRYDSFLKKIEDKNLYHGCTLNSIKKCKESNKTPCGKRCSDFKLFIDGIGKPLDRISEKNIVIDFENLPDLLRRDWNDIAQNMFGFGCSFKKGIPFV